MKAAGIIVEYNPLHNGHMIQLLNIKKLRPEKPIVAVMSGNFVQRGEPAIVNKWARTEMALAAGVDLVIELPTVYATSSSPYFALGAVSLLESCGVVDEIFFGTEAGNLEIFYPLIDILVSEPSEWRSLLKEKLKTGIPYPAAQAQSLLIYMQNNNLLPGKASEEELTALMSQPNNILALEYLKALRAIESAIRPVTIRRVGAGHHTTTLSNGFIASATAIRKKLHEQTSHSFPDIAPFVPHSTLSILQEELEKKGGFVWADDFALTIIYLLRRKTVEEILQLPDVSEGLQFRLQAAAFHSNNYEEILTFTKTRRYPRTRLQRTLIHCLLGITKDDVEAAKESRPQYIRVLGFSESGQKLLAKMRENAKLPILMRVSPRTISTNSMPKPFTHQLKLDIMATDIYVLGYKNENKRKGGLDFLTSVIRMK